MPSRRPAALALALTLVTLAGSALPTRAATASLVADINSGTESPFNSSGPFDLLPLGGKVLFVLLGGSQYELWVSDGTALGTAVVTDVCPEGSCDAPDLLAATARIAFFSTNGQLWSTDGTAAGTFPVAPSPDFQGPFTTAPVLAGDILYFRICEQEGCSLWKSDGTVAGTGAVAGFEGRVGPYELTAVGGTLFFLANTTNGNPDLWRSDGTAAGTVALHTFFFSTPRLLTAAGGRLLFVAESAADGEGPGNGELWASDGTVAGTRPLTDFVAPNPFNQTNFLEVEGGAVYFVADDVTGGADLWTSDGTPAGTRRVTDFGFAHPFDFGFGPGQFEKVGSRLLFIASDGISGQRLWTSDGTPAGTAPLAGCPGGCPSVEEVFGEKVELVPVGSRIVFSGRDPERGFEPWSSDGTAAGTRRVRDICPGTCSSLPMGFTVLRGQAYFAASAAAGQTGPALWRTDGTSAGTRRLGPRAFAHPVETFRPVVAGRKLFFLVFDPVHGPQLWVSDGTVAGTGLVTLVGDAGANSFPRALVAAGGRVVFTACDGQELGHWGSDGTAAGTLLLPAPTVGCSSGSFFTSGSAGSLAFFVREEGFETRRLWRTDGTPAGTLALASLDEAVIGLPVAFGGRFVFPVTGPDSASLWTTDGTPAGTAKAFDLPDRVFGGIRFLTALGGRLYFLADSDETIGEDDLWVSDGTAAGTVRLAAFESFPPPTPPEFTLAGGRVYFVAEGRLWKTDGTPAGTMRVLPIDSQASHGVFGLQALGGSVLFFTNTGPGSPRGLWRSDGTVAGTTLLAAVAPRVRFQFELVAAEATALGAQILFAAEDGVHGVELWRTDGTAAGTALVRDIAPGAASANPTSLVVAGGRLYFAAGDPVHGRELWQSDGTMAGTRLVQDIVPGGSPSAPQELTAAGGRLFFSADDGVHGRELWALPLDPGPATCQASANALCLNGGRFRVEVFWRDFQGRTGEGRAVALTADTGYFWFFNPANVEVVLKVLDGRGVNGHYWVFFGALTNVEYALTVTDTQTGAARRYVNPSGRFGSLGDTNAFGLQGATGSGLSLGPAPEAAAFAAPLATATAAVPCIAGPTRLCLNGGRFAVEARWRDFQGKTGVGMAVPVTGDTGYFWFFNAANVEVMLKVLDGRELNGKFWVFYGALSNVEYTLTVTDTATGATKEYPNPSGRFASVGDTGAF